MSYKVNVVTNDMINTANGVAGLDGNAQIPAAQVPDAVIKRHMAGRFLSSTTNVTTGIYANVLLPSNVKITPHSINIAFDSPPSGYGSITVDWKLNGSSLLITPFYTITASSLYSIGVVSFTNGYFTTPATDEPPNYLQLYIDSSWDTNAKGISFLFDFFVVDL